MIALNLLAAVVNEANFQVNRRLVFSLYAEAEKHDSAYGWAVFARLSYVRKEVLGGMMHWLACPLVALTGIANHIGSASLAEPF
uniref:hypothetical protein n=1 Tax=Pseudomonas sp. Z003-0.4C(8344-21) TaxID=1855380 RepID=UPI0012FD0CF2|nr:hypothetical protein [Pseudomonas sp. Z003-0.4C(8344-21)]